MTQPTTLPYRKLRRPTDDRILAGVCSGIARYLTIDPTLIRVTFAILAILTWGTALLAYPALWFLIPDAPASELDRSAPADDQPTTPSR